MVKKANKFCLYKNFCPFSTESGTTCSIEDQKDCDEAKRIKELTDKPCPIMQEAGYKKEMCKCDIPVIRVILPQGVDCTTICKGREAIKSLHDYLSKYMRDGYIKIDRDGLNKIFLEAKKSKK